MKRKISKIIAYVMSMLMVFHPVAYTQPQQPDVIQQAAQQGRDAGTDIVNSFTSAQTTENNGAIQMPSMTTCQSNWQTPCPGGGQFNNNTNTTLSASDLFPGTAAPDPQNPFEPSTQDPMSTFFPAAATPDIGALQGSQASTQTHEAMKTELFNDANSANPTIQGSAYGAALDIYRLSKPDLANDPVLDLSRNVIASSAVVNFADCGSDAYLQAINKEAHTPEYFDCERILDPSASCTIMHDLGVVHTTDEYHAEMRVTRWDISGDNEHCTVEILPDGASNPIVLDGHFDDDGHADNPLGLRENTSANCNTLLNHYIVSNSFGYADAFRAHGIPIPDSGFPIDLPYENLCGTPPCTDWNPFVINVDTQSNYEAWRPTGCVGMPGGTINSSSDQYCNVYGSHTVVNYHCRTYTTASCNTWSSRQVAVQSSGFLYIKNSRNLTARVNLRTGVHTITPGEANISTVPGVGMSDNGASVSPPTSASLIQPATWASWRYLHATRIGNDYGWVQRPTSANGYSGILSMQYTGVLPAGDYYIGAWFNVNTSATETYCSSFDYTDRRICTDHQANVVLETDFDTSRLDSSVCEDATPRLVNGGTANPPCWEWHDTYLVDDVTYDTTDCEDLGSRDYCAVAGTQCQIWHPRNYCEDDEVHYICDTSQQFIDQVLNVYLNDPNVTVDCTAEFNLDENGCTLVNGRNVCLQDMMDAPAGLDKSCQQAVINMDFTVTNGDVCFDTPSGRQCFNANSSGCEQYEQDPRCGFISSDCNSEDTAGRCLVNGERWDCGPTFNVPTTAATNTMNCPGAVRCMGTDCVTGAKDESQDFANVTALLNATTFMTQDMACTGQSIGGCEVFAGEAYTCKTALGGVQDCCDVPTNVGVGDYITMMLAVAKLDTSIMAMEQGSSVKGAYQVLREPVANMYSQVTKPFTSYIENVKGAVDTFVDPVQEVVDELIQQLKDKVREIMNNMFQSMGQDLTGQAAGSATTDALTDSAAEKATDELLANVAGAASTVMAIYTAYVMAMMVIQAIYECDATEFELAAKIATRSCHYVGTYCADHVLDICVEERESHCCFNSPMSRIINEQVRLQPAVIGDWGSDSNPTCGGIPIDEIVNIDWTQVDLSEWIGLLAANDLLKDAQNIGLDSITGAGTTFDIDPDNPRLNASDRTIERLNGTDIDTVRKDEVQSLTLPTGG